MKNYVEFVIAVVFEEPIMIVTIGLQKRQKRILCKILSRSNPLLFFTIFIFCLGYDITGEDE
jgi:hypothetical protein